SNNVMVPGKGYIIRAPQGFTPTPQPFTGIFNGGSNDGIPNNGVINIPIVVAGANVMNLIGNPYPSGLDADAFLLHPGNVSTIDGVMYFGRHNTAITDSEDTGSDYAIYNVDGGTGTSPATSPGVNVQTPNGFDGSGQAFFVKGITGG